MPSRIDEVGHTKAFDYPVAEHWGESQRTKRSELVGQSFLGLSRCVIMECHIDGSLHPESSVHLYINN